MKIFIILSVLFINIILAKPLVFGVVPQQSPQKLYKAWKPFIDFIAKDIGVEIVFKTEKSIPEFEKKLYSGAYDIAYSNPYHYTIVHKKQNHNAIARFDKQIVGILVAKKNSDIQSIHDVKNKEFLFPAPRAFAATILTKFDVLNKQNYSIDKSKKFRYVNSHDSVYLGVQRGIGEIGGGIVRTFNKFKYKDSLKIIYKTDKYPSHPISIRQNIDRDIANKIKKSLLTVPFKISKLINKKSIIKTQNNEYDVVKELAIKLNIFN